MLPAPADGDVAAALDATGGLDQASAEDRSTRAWQVSRPLDEDALDGPRPGCGSALLVLQGLAILVVLVLCAPTTEQSRAAGARHEPMSRQTRPGAAGSALPPPERVARGLRARLNLTAVLAVCCPLLTVGALALVRPAERGRRRRTRPARPASTWRS